jgi:hypothetical protein
VLYEIAVATGLHALLRTVVGHPVRPGPLVRWRVDQLPGVRWHPHSPRANRLRLPVEKRSREDVDVARRTQRVLACRLLDLTPSFLIEFGRLGGHVGQRERLRFCSFGGHVAGGRHLPAVVAAALVVVELRAVRGRKARLGVEAVRPLDALGGLDAGASQALDGIDRRLAFALVQGRVALEAQRPLPARPGHCRHEPWEMLRTLCEVARRRQGGPWCGSRWRPFRKNRRNLDAAARQLERGQYPDESRRRSDDQALDDRCWTALASLRC